MPRLTKSLVDSLQPRPKRYDVQCDALRGFVIRVNADGTRSAAFRYFRDGQRRRVTLGLLGPGFTFEQARRKAISIRGQVQDGADPARERDTRRGAATFAEVAQRYMETVAEPYMKPTTVAGYRSLVNRHLLPALGGTKITAIERQDVMRLHTRIGEAPKVAKPKRKRKGAGEAATKPVGTTKGAANRARSLLSAIMAAAEKWGLRPVGSNPCLGTPKFRERKIKRYLSAEERARLEAVLYESERATKGKEAYVCRGSVDAVRLLSLTGARKSEITGLQWSMVDLERAELRLPESKTGEKVIALSSNAVELLRQLEARRDPAVPWVCAGEQGRRLHNLPRAWESIRHRAGLDDVRLHDLRHSFASDALNAGVPLAAVGGMLGHKRVETTARYAHLDDKVMRAAVETTGAKIDASTREGAERLQQRAVGDASRGEGSRGGEVIPIGGRAKVITMRPRGKR
jgi:integrase